MKLSFTSNGTFKERIHDLLNEGVNDGVSEGVNDGVKLRLITVVMAIMEKKGIRANDLAKKIKKSYATTERYISILRKFGIITFEGPPKTGGYVLTKKAKQRLESDPAVR